jgi:integrase
LLKVADNDWQGAIQFAYGHAVRLADVANLKWSALQVYRDIDGETKGIADFRELKTSQRAVHTLHADFLEWLQKQPVPFNREQPVFPALASQPIGGENGLSNTFTKLCDAAGIEKRLIRQANAGKGRSVRALTFHSLRHTAASIVYNEAAKETARKVTNHAPGGVIDRYIHENIEAKQAATNLIPRLPK